VCGCLRIPREPSVTTGTTGTMRDTGRMQKKLKKIIPLKPAPPLGCSDLREFISTKSEKVVDTTRGLCKMATIKTGKNIFSENGRGISGINI